MATADSMLAEIQSETLQKVSARILHWEFDVYDCYSFSRRSVLRVSASAKHVS
jgi:hypothetical protein